MSDAFIRITGTNQRGDPFLQKCSCLNRSQGRIFSGERLIEVVPVDVQLIEQWSLIEIRQQRNVPTVRFDIVRPAPVIVRGIGIGRA